MRIKSIFAALALCCSSLPSAAQESPLVALQTSDAGREWQAVGRLNIGDTGFCTGTLIEPQLVLTAAHCLFNKETGARVDPTTIEFQAGLRNGRAEAYRLVRRAVAHPDYVYAGLNNMDRVAYDVALLELDQPVRLPSIAPFATDVPPQVNDEVGVVSYAKDRAEAPSLQEVCHVLDKSPTVLILSCNVDFGSSGAPIFALRGAEMKIVSVVSAKAEVDGKPVALGTSLVGPLETLYSELAKEAAPMNAAAGTVRLLSGGSAGGAKFIKP